ncbi:metal-dependent hydrolase [Candidatus Pacearchaeota archaeon]|nr:metal-dependent hydrolase [Candidatus Pacearchaeota archaeon]
MIMRTHLALGIAAMLFFLPHAEHIFVFIPVILIATLLPDIDSGFSYMGKKPLFRPIQWFSKHRGFIHSFTFCTLVAVVLSLYFPIAALPFFLGYSFHLLIDSFTIEGIQPFWPLKGKVHGGIKTGGRIEDGLFLFLCFLSLIFFALIFIA